MKRAKASSASFNKSGQSCCLCSCTDAPLPGQAGALGCNAEHRPWQAVLYRALLALDSMAMEPQGSPELEEEAIQV